ncbi:MAG: hypothetical protein RRY38_03205, partial [Oscillospiraceae bacterium]
MIIKYKLGELAKDLELTNKEVVAALGSYGTDKKHTTALSEPELNFFFDNLTQQHSAVSFDQYIVEHNPAAAKPAPAEKSGDSKVDEAFEKAAARQLEKQERKGDKPVEVIERVSKVIDTRAAVTNVDKYNEKYENIAQVTAQTSKAGG